MQTVRPFLSRCFRFSPRGGSRVEGKLLCALDRGFGLSGIMGMLQRLYEDKQGEGAIGERTRGKSYLGKVFRSEILCGKNIFLFEKD